MYFYAGTQQKQFQGQNDFDNYDIGITNISLISIPDDAIIVNRHFVVSDVSSYRAYTTSGYIPYKFIIYK